MAQENEIINLLAPYGAFVTYVPLRTEVPFRDYLTVPSTAVMYEIEPRASLDPAEEAQKAIAALGDKSVAILIPGRLFDATGTRHGRGGGWYDRFLTAVPNGWFRIGVCYEHQFSQSPLFRETWDQPMNTVVVVNNESATVYRT